MNEQQQLQSAGAGDVTLKQLAHRVEVLTSERDAALDRERRALQQLEGSEEDACRLEQRCIALEKVANEAEANAKEERARRHEKETFWNEQCELREKALREREAKLDQADTALANMSGALHDCFPDLVVPHDETYYGAALREAVKELRAEHMRDVEVAFKTSDQAAARSLCLECDETLDQVRAALGVGEGADLVEVAKLAGGEVLRELGCRIGMDDYVHPSDREYWSVDNVQRHVVWLEQRECARMQTRVDEAQECAAKLRGKWTEAKAERDQLRAERDSDAWRRGWTVAVRERDEARREGDQLRARLAECERERDRLRARTHEIAEAKDEEHRERARELGKMQGRLRDADAWANASMRAFKDERGVLSEELRSGRGGVAYPWWKHASEHNRGAVLGLLERADAAEAQLRDLAARVERARELLREHASQADQRHLGSQDRIAALTLGTTRALAALTAAPAVAPKAEPTFDELLQVTHDMLSLVMDGKHPSVDELRRRTVAELCEAEQWAALVHLDASDNNVPVPPKPAWLAAEAPKAEPPFTTANTPYAARVGTNRMTGDVNVRTVPSAARASIEPGETARTWARVEAYGAEQESDNPVVAAEAPGREGPRTHDLKTWPEFFSAVLDGRKTFELRKNDRDFRVGDALRLQEYEPGPDRYTGRECTRVVTYVTEALPFAPLKPGFVCLGLAPGREGPGERDAARDRVMQAMRRAIAEEQRAAQPGANAMSSAPIVGVFRAFDEYDRNRAPAAPASEPLHDACRKLLAAVYVGDGRIVCPNDLHEPIRAIYDAMRGAAPASEPALPEGWKVKYTEHTCFDMPAWVYRHDGIDAEVTVYADDSAIVDNDGTRDITATELHAVLAHHLATRKAGTNG